MLLQVLQITTSLPQWLTLMFFLEHPWFSHSKMTKQPNRLFCLPQGNRSRTSPALEVESAALIAFMTSGAGWGCWERRRLVVWDEKAMNNTYMGGAIRCLGYVFPSYPSYWEWHAWHNLPGVCGFLEAFRYLKAKQTTPLLKPQV